ncbi:MAG: hypothetical protein HY547_05355 [Elusimicrobia bacterium]|nr:hypothetical protein [Elusimicrobiota bacterium]
MPLREEIEETGLRLFKKRSYVPFLFVPIALTQLPDAVAIEKALGPEINFFLTAFCIAISLSGLAIRCLTIGHAPRGTSGRNTHGQVADSLNTKGIYSLVRHPLYLGNFLIFLGLLIFIKSWLLILAGAAAFWIYYERIMLAEEEFLRKKYGDVFISWASRTPAFVPRLEGWQKPNIEFSWKNTFRREYTGLFVVTASFTLLRILVDFVGDDRWHIERRWLEFFAGGAFFYLLFLTLKRRTTLLDVPGR